MSELKLRPPKDINEAGLVLRVRREQEFLEHLGEAGAKFITAPKVHATELRCYMRDPDGYLIEVERTGIRGITRL